MAEYWTGRKWVSDEKKSVNDLIGVPKIYKGSQGKGQMYITVLPRAIANPKFAEIEQSYDRTKNQSFDELNITVLTNRRGHSIVYHGTPSNFYPEYFMINE